MQAHIIENGVIANTIEVESLNVFPGVDLVDAALGGRIGDAWANGAPVPQVAPAAPDEVSPIDAKRQAVLQLSDALGVDRAALAALFAVEAT